MGDEEGCNAGGVKKKEGVVRSKSERKRFMHEKMGNVIWPLGDAVRKRKWQQETKRNLTARSGNLSVIAVHGM